MKKDIAANERGWMPTQASLMISSREKKAKV